MAISLGGTSFRHAAMLATGLIAGLTLSSCDSGPVDMPYGTAQQMMANEVQPAADIYWGAVKFESLLIDDEVVERDIRPETDEEWEIVRASAARLAELGEVLQTSAYADGRGEDWMDFAKGMTDVSLRAEQAAVAQDPDAVFEVGGTVYNVCRACHQMYPPAELPDGATVDDQRPSDDMTLEEYTTQGDN